MLRLSPLHSNPTFTAIDPMTALGSNIPASGVNYSDLAKLSQQKLWILYTANCPRPLQSELSQHDINCDNVIHMKPSNLYSEEEIVLKAIQAGTASAVVGSSALDTHARARLRTVASQKGCEVFFLTTKQTPAYLTH